MEKDAYARYTLEEIREKLSTGLYPVSGITELGSAAFHFREPAMELGVALHSSSRIRSGLDELLLIHPEKRAREEDLYTELLLKDFQMVVVAQDSRFEYDLNWEEENCIYAFGVKKWGLDVWKRPLQETERTVTLQKYREFHGLLDLMVEFMISANDAAILYDIHSYRYQREEQISWWEDLKPEINLGTRYINRDFFSLQVEAFLEGISGYSLDGKELRVGENLAFPGGYLTRKYAASHNKQVLVLAIEFKKIYMNEWTGKLYPEKLDLLKSALCQTKEIIPRIQV